MMSDHGANLIFFNKRIKIRRPQHSLTPRPPPSTSDNVSFLSYPPPLPPPPPTLKVEVICASPLTGSDNYIQE